MKHIDICRGYYASKWSLTDFYPESEQLIMEVLASGDDFDTGWFGCKKEIHYARYCRENGKITIEVSANMDDLYESDDLICDALWTLYRSEDGLPYEIIDSIRDVAIDCGIDDHTTIEVTLPGTASFADVVEATDKAETEAENHNTEAYNRLCEIVRDHVEYYNKLKKRKGE